MDRDNENIKQFRSIVFKMGNKRFPVYVVAFAVFFVSGFVLSINLEVSAQGPFDSGYNQGCEDAQITDSADRYMNQRGKGPESHSSSFMNGYYEGFNECYDEDDYPTSSDSSNGTFKVNVEVTNNSFRDTFGNIVVNVDQDPDDVSKSAYGVYFPAKDTVTKTFSFKSSEVPIGAEFNVNINYGNNLNQSGVGENTPSMRTELVQFNIP